VIGENGVSQVGFGDEGTYEKNFAATGLGKVMDLRSSVG
jgi:hypothetical protein